MLWVEFLSKPSATRASSSARHLRDNAMWTERTIRKQTQLFGGNVPTEDFNLYSTRDQCLWLCGGWTRIRVPDLKRRAQTGPWSIDVAWCEFFPRSWETGTEQVTWLAAVLFLDEPQNFPPKMPHLNRITAVHFNPEGDLSYPRMRSKLNESGSEGGRQEVCPNGHHIVSSRLHKFKISTLITHNDRWYALNVKNGATYREGFIPTLDKCHTILPTSMIRGLGLVNNYSPK